MSLKFSRRTAWDMAESEWARLLRARRASGMPILDLTASNPTRCGIEYDDQTILAPLGKSEALRYDPVPQGLPAARLAVADYYASHRASVDPEHLLLTTSTSEAYSFLFRLLCDPGDEVLIAQPSYPLFDFLATLDDVRLVSYPLFFDYGWHLDVEAMRSKITPRTRAIALVHPNNPTGHYTSPAERAILEELCVEYGLALIVDEVFFDYPLIGSEGAPSFASGEHPALTFVLSGLSKVAGLPQMKVAWIAACGPASAVHEALPRLEVIADTFLSMSAPVQHALPAWLASRGDFQAQVKERTQQNLRSLDQMLRPDGLLSRLETEAGWSVVLRMPAVIRDEETACSLIRDNGIAVHSGDFFGFGPKGWLVASLLPRAKEFASGINGIIRYLASVT